MKKSVVIAEKPSVARDIARVLNCHKKGNGFLEGDKYIVTWALGHLVTLADPESYDVKYKTWNLEDLPMLPNDLKLVVIKQTSKQYNAVKSQLVRTDVSDIIIATDAGREGELVARWIIEKAKVNKPIKRLWISSVTDKAIKEGFQNLKSGKAYENLYHAAVARSEADWYIGLNATRALTSKFNAQLSCGRVQTPTVAIIAQREDEIRNFKPKTFYGVEAHTTNNLKLAWQDRQTNDMRTFSKEKAEQVIAKVDNKQGTIIEVDKKQKKNFAPQLYDLTELQRDANKIFGFSAKETLGIMQTLYERHKVLTYPRTDSRYLSSDIVETLPERLKSCGIGQYRQLANKVLQKPIKANKAFVDDSKVSDHHAIIPTEEIVNQASFTDKERKIYDLVVKRFLAVLYPPFEYEQITVKASIGDETFVARGKTILSSGWKEVYENRFDEDENADDMKEQILPRIEKGDKLSIKFVNETSGQTKPPARFNEASLLTAMENPAKYMGTQDKELAKTLDKTGGLGTVATRADIIEKLFNSFLLEKRGKDIYLTSKGKQLLDLVPADLKTPALTAEWEQKLEAIAKGKLNKNLFIGEMKNYTKTIVSDIKNSDKKFKHDNISTKSCPDCGKPMLEVNGKKGKMLVCQDRECGHRKNVSRVTNARCPQCKKKLELRGEGDGQIFTCTCGYREKLSAFEARRKKTSGGKADKRDVQKYMKKQNKEEEPVNNALAEALKNLKL
ncbi:DNA topoisomerase III [Psychrobacillus lasiicapitis]|uniref:DNA topoisomerase 3 n=1 Tax=Psychrobacillus lasiicapitis TaxID=1636719 RepID=A0A544TC56_9BACI|nr:DNA topoisomerase III [Psychrobacillus lasiicapitis]TQR15043.1 DNA topoisomerase III [Psychrobacillus lasiicapitis]GGA21993.1 DNA topoisomerase 3 [Psychrobacillus lasiicapitis]